jgi:hypothetical protein
VSASSASDARSAPPQRFFFVHLQKTAGTALLRRMVNHFGPAGVYPGPDDGAPPLSTLAVDNLLARWNARQDEIRVVTGHFPLCTVELLGAPFDTLTILREPVERTLSFLRHHREMTPEDADRPLEDIYSDPLRFELVHNHMVKMFSLSVDEMTDGALTHVTFSRERLDRAKERLAAVDVVGVQEHFDDFCETLRLRYGWDLGAPLFMNRTKPVDVAEPFRRRIADDNALDVELYEFALDARARLNRTG